MSTPKRKINRGCPSKYSLKIQKEICAHIETGSSKESAAILSGIGKTILFDWQNKRPDFAKAIELAVEKRRKARIKRIIEAGEDRIGPDGKLIRGDWRADAQLLKWEHREDYADFGIHQVQGHKGGAISIEVKPPIDLSRFTDAELDAMGPILQDIIKNGKSESHTNGNGNGSSG